MTFVAAAGLLPGILASRLIGRLCDSKYAKQALLSSIAFRISTTAGIILIHQYYIFLLLVAIRSILSSVAIPAISSLAAREIHENYLPGFYATLKVINSIAKIIAPTIGTISSAFTGEIPVLLASSALATIALAVLSLVRQENLRHQTIPQTPNKGKISNDEQMTTPKNRPELSTILFLGGIHSFYVFMVNNLVPIVLAQYGYNKSMLGILISSAGAANVISGLWSARANKISPVQATVGNIIRPASVQAVGFLAIGTVLMSDRRASYILLPTLFFFIGLAATRHAIALNVYLARTCCGAVGRATALLQAIQNAAIIIAPLTGSVILANFGGAALFFSSAIFAFVLYGAFQAIIVSQHGSKARWV